MGRPEKTEDVLVPIRGLKLTDWGYGWWSTLGDLGSTTIGALVRWPFIEKHHPEILEIPVENQYFQHIPVRTLLVGGYRNGELLPLTRIYLNMHTRDWPTPERFLKSIVHEVQHLIQQKEGRFPHLASIPSVEGYRDFPWEIEARESAGRVPRQKRRRYNPGPSFKLKKFKQGEGISYRAYIGRKKVAHISGFEEDKKIDGVWTPVFHIYRTFADESVRGTGLYREAVQLVADNYPGGAYVHGWESSGALQASLKKLPTFFYEQENDRLWVLPTRASSEENG